MFDFASPATTGGVNEGAKTIVLTVPNGTDVTALIPTIIMTGASISPVSGLAQDFTSPVTYTVTAEDSTTQAYIVTVTVSAPSSGGGGGGGGGYYPVVQVPSVPLALIDDLVGVVLGEKIVDERELQLSQIFDDAHYVWEGNIDVLLGYGEFDRDLESEDSVLEKYESVLTPVEGEVDEDNLKALINFIAYGTKTTSILGAGERAGVLNSYKSAFGELPQTEDEWIDVIKISNGRWPSKTNDKAETRAKESFEKIYLREPDMSNPNDNAAVTTMAYGLRPLPRNLDSEKTAILTLKDIYGFSPVSAVDWDIVRAIAYSGATR